MKKYKKLYIASITIILLFSFQVANGAWFNFRSKVKLGSPTLYPAMPLKTNQTQCYDASNVLTSCSNTVGQDGNYVKGQTRGYIDNGNNTITDNSTGLMWSKCSEGQSGSTCATGSATTATWPNAITACEASTLAGYTDWRLPNVNELQTLADYGRFSPSINITYFPNTASNYYWSASTYVVSPSSAWVVYFGNGVVYYNSKTNGNYVRCVR